MHHTTFSIQEAFENAWEILKKKFELLAGTIGFMVLLSWGFSFMKQIVDPITYRPAVWGGHATSHHNMMGMHTYQGSGEWVFNYTPMIATHHSFIEILMGLVVSLIGCIVITIVGIGVTRIYFKVARHESAHFRSVLHGEDRFIPYILAVLISSAAIVLGLILFVLPGIFIALRLSMVKLYVVDRNVGPLEAITLSWHATRGQAWQLFGLLLVAILVNLLGALAFGVGLLVTIPLTILAFIDVYEKLSHRHQAV